MADPTNAIVAKWEQIPAAIFQKSAGKAFIEGDGINKYIWMQCLGGHISKMKLAETEGLHAAAWQQ